MIKKIVTGLLALALCIGAAATAVPAAGAAGTADGVTIWGYSEGLALAEKDGLWGYANVARQIVIPIQYSSALDFSLGMAQVKLGYRLGVIRQDGQYLIEPQYSSLYHINSGIYLAQKGTQWGVVSILPFPDGKGGTTDVLYDFIYDRAEVVEQGGVEVLTLYQGSAKTSIPVFDLPAMLQEKQVPSAQFPLTRGLVPDFSDVSPRDWYAVWVDIAYNVGLMSGVGGDRFAPSATLTVAEALQLAATMESRYKGDDFHLRKPSGAQWYQPAVEYCVASGIIKSGEFSSYTRPVTRREMARIFGSTTLARELPNINSLDRVKALVPDIAVGSAGAGEIYSLYAKGILSGVDSKLTFRPDATITRAEVAAIVARMARAEQRVTLWGGTLQSALDNMVK